MGLKIYKEFVKLKVQNNKNIQLAFYGDDFTGSTDALECLTKAGAKAILFTEAPSLEELKAFPNLDAYGIAGKTRALVPNEMEIELTKAFEQMKNIGSKHIHYKICSTFDSSPEIGSIGKAIDCFKTVFGESLLPIFGGNPALGRYCIFGNLFAQMGIGSTGKIYRINQHPSMSKHPITPMNEADLCIHLGKQTDRKISLLNYIEQDKPIEDWPNNHGIYLLDVINENQLLKIADWINANEIKYSVGSSSVEMAFSKYWHAQQIFSPTINWPTVQKASPLLVLSGSCSPITKNQIAYALAQGFVEMPLQMKTCNGELGSGFSIECNFEEIENAINENQHVIVHTGKIEQIADPLSAFDIGNLLGHIAKKALEKTNLKRIIIAGGDTSSYTARTMEITAVEMIAPVVIGAPLCKAYSNNKNVNGIEVNFKGGQVGSENYFTLF